MSFSNFALRENFFKYFHLILRDGNKYSSAVPSQNGNIKFKLRPGEENNVAKHPVINRKYYIFFCMVILCMYCDVNRAETLYRTYLFCASQKFTKPWQMQPFRVEVRSIPNHREQMSIEVFHSCANPKLVSISSDSCVRLCFASSHPKSPAIKKISIWSVDQRSNSLTVKGCNKTISI